MSPDAEHRLHREMLGAYALDGLTPPERVTVRAHLDGCRSCRDELAEILPLAQDLRSVDLTRLQQTTAPPLELGGRIRELVVRESAWREARTRRGRRLRALRRGTAAAALVGIALAGGVALERIRDDAPVPPVASEPLQLLPVGREQPVVTRAALVPHTWGVEVRMAGSGFVEGATYRASFRTEDGDVVPAGEFLGTGESDLRCNLQAAALREATTTFVIADERGRPVLMAQLAS